MNPPLGYAPVRDNGLPAAERQIRKVSEYQAHANECRKLAASMKDPEHKKQLQFIIEAWEMLAKERQK
jgi:hypothetical protein